MAMFESDNLNKWHQHGRLERLKCRLGEFDVFCIDEQNANAEETLLLIHGFPTSSYDFAPMWNALRVKYRLVTLDMLGFGFSDKPNHRQHTIHQQADLFESLIKKLELKSFHVIAHDYGVSVAQELLARQLESTGAGNWRSCSLLNGGLFPETHRALFIQKLMLSPLGPVINRFAGFEQFSKSFSRVFGSDTQPTESELREFWEAISFNNGRHVFHNLITYMADRRQHRARWVDALRNSNVPMALINGSVDPVSGAHLVTRYKELNCRLDFLKELPTLGHYPHVEDPKAVTIAILDFLSKI